jgi:hypothetical protein
VIRTNIQAQLSHPRDLAEKFELLGWKHISQEDIRKIKKDANQVASYCSPLNAATLLFLLNKKPDRKIEFKTKVAGKKDLIKKIKESILKNRKIKSKNMSNQKLPVGVCFSNYYTNKDRQTKEQPILRVSAHITINGLSEAKHFFPHILGMEAAIEQATTWRTNKLQETIRLGITHKKLNLEGKRKT